MDHWFRPLRQATLLVMVALFALAGCGGGTHVNTQAIVKQVEAQVQKHCTVSDYAIQCGLPTIVQPRLAQDFSANTSTTLQGIDFAWTKFSPSQAGSFGASYASTDSSKDWSKSLINAYHTAGKGTVVVWETSATRAAQGCAAGRADAQAGESLLAQWGFPHSHLNMAIDFDASGQQVFDYFNCANQTFPGLIGAYGGFRPLQYLCSKGVITKSWQTYAWSGGQWLPSSCAPLEQYLNGSQFDHDRAIAADYGQFPTPSTGPSQATIRGWRQSRNVNFTAYHKHHCTNGLDAYPCNFAANNVLHYQGLLWTVYKKWSCWGSKARTKSEVCWIIRPEVSRWSQKRDSTQRAYDNDGCTGPAGFGTGVHTPHCNTLRQRLNYFLNKVGNALKTYGG